MANELDELTGPVNPQGQDINVIAKQLPVKIGFGSLLFEIALWATIPVATIIAVALLHKDIYDPVIVALIGCGAGLIPGLIFQYMKTKAHNYFQQLQQKIQTAASNVDNFIEQRVTILENVAALVDRAIKLDRETMTEVAALRSGVAINSSNRNAVASQMEEAFSRINVQIEAYPELKAHQAIADAMQQNSYLQKEITAARTVYNERVNQWNTDIFDWPTKMIVAAREGYTTRIPFVTTKAIKDRSRQVFF